MNKTLKDMKAQMRPSDETVEKLYNAIESGKAPTRKREFSWAPAIAAAAFVCVVTAFALVVVPVLNSPINVTAGGASEVGSSVDDVVPEITTEAFEVGNKGFVSPLLDCEFEGESDFYLVGDGSASSNLFSLATEGTKVYPSQNGKVIMAENHGNYGNAVMIDHGDDVYSMYYHLGEILVTEGQEVVQSETVLGTVGETGWTSGVGLGYSCFSSKADVYVNSFFAPPLRDVELPADFNYTDTQNEELNTNEIYINAPKGTEVYPVKSGEVIFSDWYDNYGYLVAVLHSDSLTLYAHLDEHIANVGDTVTTETIIGTVGSTGKAFSNALGYSYCVKGEKEYDRPLQNMNKKTVIGDKLVFDVDGDGTDEE